MAAAVDEMKFWKAYTDLPSYENRNTLENQLTEIGWKIVGFEYISPCQTFSFGNLHDVCHHLEQQLAMKQLAIVPHEEDEDLEQVPPHEEDSEAVKPVECPEALQEWIDIRKGKDLSLRAKQHLRFLGWGVQKILKKKGQSRPSKLEDSYESPTPRKRKYGSLVSACKVAIEAEAAANEAQQHQQQQHQQEQLQQQQHQQEQLQQPPRPSKMHPRKSVGAQSGGAVHE